MSKIQHRRDFKWNRDWIRIDFGGLNEEGVRARQDQYEIYVRGWISKQNEGRETQNAFYQMLWTQLNPRFYEAEVNIDPGPIEDIPDDKEEGGGNLSPTPPPQPPPPVM